MVKKQSERSDVDETSSPGADLQPLPMVPVCGTNAAVIGVFALNDAVAYPEYQTDAAGCMDLAADLSTHNAFLKYWEPVMNRQEQKPIREDSSGRHILIEPGERVLIPTGLIFAISPGYSINTFIRSSVGLKKGLMLANGVGYIDEDYRNELFMPIINQSRAQVRIDDKERLAQAEVRPAIQATILTLDERPSLVGNRSGGFGSTGKK